MTSISNGGLEKNTIWQMLAMVDQRTTWYGKC